MKFIIVSLLIVIAVTVGVHSEPQNPISWQKHNLKNLAEVEKLAKTILPQKLVDVSVGLLKTLVGIKPLFERLAVNGIVGINGGDETLSSAQDGALFIIENYLHGTNYRPELVDSAYSLIKALVVGEHKEDVLKRVRNLLDLIIGDGFFWNAAPVCDNGLAKHLLVGTIGSLYKCERL